MDILFTGDVFILFTLVVPTPASINITTDSPTPISAETRVTLTCTVELSPSLAGLSLLAVIVTWTGPLGTLSGSDPTKVANSPPTYTSMLTLASVESSGSFICQAQVDSPSSFIAASQTTSASIFLNVSIIGKLH